MNAQKHIEDVLGHLAAAIRQRSSSDDRIIAEHIVEAYEAAKKARIVLEFTPHDHAAGTIVEKNIDECAVCGHDLRHPIHAPKQKSMTEMLAALPIIGVINVDDPHDPPHKEW